MRSRKKQQSIGNVHKTSSRTVLLIICITGMLLYAWQPVKAEPFAYVTNGNVGTVSIIDAALHMVIATVNVGGSLRDVAVLPDETRAYVVVDGIPGAVAVIDTASRAVVAVIPVGNNPNAIAAAPDGGHVYVTNNDSSFVSVISTMTNTITATIPVSSVGYRSIAVTPDSRTAYAVNGLADRIAVLDLVANTVRATINQGGSPSGVVISRDGTRAYVALTAARGLIAYNTATNTAIRVVVAGPFPWRADLSVDGILAYTVNQGDNTVTVARTMSPGSLIATIPIGGFPTDIALTPDGTLAYVTNFTGDAVSVISTASNTVIGTIPVGDRPSAVAFRQFQNQPPTASFDFEPKHPENPQGVLPGVPITFTSSSVDPDGQIIESVWNFGDGTTAEGVEVTHTFAQEGQFHVALSVVDNQGEPSLAHIKIIDTHCKAGETALVPTDCDGDALHNDWEMLGVDTDEDGTRDLDLKEMGADPLKKDVFVWIDWLVGEDGHSHKPSNAALNLVRDKFLERGINLHTFLQNEIPEDGYELLLECITKVGDVCKENDAILFNEIREEFFLEGNSKKSMASVFHYALFAHLLVDVSSGTLGGAVEGRSDFAVAHEYIRTNQDPYIDISAFEGATFMHELGHTLGLGHGGIKPGGEPDEDNYKPNHLSIMNYAFGRGLVVNLQGGILDYSIFDNSDIPDLIENGGLDEIKGLNGISNINDYMVRWYCGKTDKIGRSVLTADRVIDWNCNKKSNETNITYNVNKDTLEEGNVSSPDKINKLHTWNEWKYLVFNHGTIGLSVQQIPPYPERFSIDAPDLPIEEILKAGWVGDLDGDRMLNEEDECPQSDNRSTLIINECDSGVNNHLFQNGCTISDRIDPCVENAQNHGQFVSCVAQLTNDLKGQGIITSEEKVNIDSCAAPPQVLPALTSLGPSQAWVGLKNSDAVGLRLDLQAEVFLNETKVGTGQLNNIPSGSSGFNNAKLDTIPLTLSAPVEVPANASLKLTLSVRRTCFGTGHNSGTARLWYNDGQANSSFGATIADTANTFFLRDGSLLATTPGPGPKKTIDVSVNSTAACPNRPFKPFGTWSVALP